jgi:hypothetical protein
VEFFWIIIVAIVAVMVVIFVWQRFNEQKRTRAWQEVAQELDMEYLGESGDILSRYGYLRVLRKGRSQRMSNVVSADAGDVRITIGDLSYRRGSGKNRHTHRRTICVLQTDAMDVPLCYLRPEVGFFDSLGSLFGGQDIDFDEDREFSRAYVLQGEDEPAIRELFNADIRAWFTQRAGQGFHFEAQGKVLLFHLGKRRPPGETRELMEQALQIMKRLAGQG